MPAAPKRGLRSGYSGRKSRDKACLVPTSPLLSLTQKNNAEGYKGQPSAISLNPYLIPMNKQFFIFFLLFLAFSSLKAQTPDSLQKIYFPNAVSQIDEQQNRQIQALAEYLKQQPSAKISIEGTADETGSNEQRNKALAQERAENVQKKLIDLGAKSTQIEMLPVRILPPSTNSSNNRYVSIRLKVANNNKAQNNSISEREALKSIDNLYAYWAQKSSETQSFPADKAQAILCEKGSFVQIPANAFALPDGSPYTGEVQLNIREAHSNGDMLLQNLSTSSNGKQLETGGMIRLQATTNTGAALQLNNNAKITVSLPSPNAKTPGMQVFLADADAANPHADSAINWQATNMPVALRTDPADNSYFFFKESHLDSLLSLLTNLAPIIAQNTPTQAARIRPSSKPKGASNQFEEKPKSAYGKYLNRLREHLKLVALWYPHIERESNAKKAQEIVTLISLSFPQGYAAALDYLQVNIPLCHQKQPVAFDALLKSLSALPAADTSATYQKQGEQLNADFKKYFPYSFANNRYNPKDYPQWLALESNALKLTISEAKTLAEKSEWTDKDVKSAQAIVDIQYDNPKIVEHNRSMQYFLLLLRNNAEILRKGCELYRPLVAMYSEFNALRKEYKLRTTDEIIAEYNNALVIDKMGWINCDRFWEDKSPKGCINVLVNASTPNFSTNSRFYIVFSDIASVMPVNLRNGKFISGEIPLNRSVQLIGIQIDPQTESIRLSVQRGKVSELKDAKPNFAPSSLSEVEQLLAKL